MTTLRILAVDDEDGMRLGIERTLEDCQLEIPEINDTVDFSVQLAETGEDAVALIRENAPDVLLLDYKLPGINGLDVLAQTAGDTPDMLTVMITAYASIETAIAATKQGAYDFLPKPFTPADLRHTIRKAATRILLARKARQLEEEKRRVRFEFIRVLGHELKAPISAVTGYLYLLRDRSLGETLDPYNTFVERSLRRLDQMTKMIGDLLDMTRMESGEKMRKLEPVDLVEAAQDALDVGREEATRREIELVIDTPETLYHQADRGEVDMIMNNLVSNAVKYNRDGGRVDVRLKAADDEIVIAVSDTGFGMTEEEIGRLFGEFVRIKNAKTRDALGSGLGLSILKRVVGLYQGTIAVESEPDKGSTFTVRLPTTIAATAADAAEEK